MTGQCHVLKSTVQDLIFFVAKLLFLPMKPLGSLRNPVPCSGISLGYDKVYVDMGLVLNKFLGIREGQEVVSSLFITCLENRKKSLCTPRTPLSEFARAAKTVRAKCCKY